MSDFRIDNSLGYIVHRLETRMRQELQRQFAAHGHSITLAQWLILNRLWEEEGLSQNDVADRTFREKTTTARTLALLEQQRLIVRQRDPSDRRHVKVSLTPAGRALKEQLIPLAADVLKRACAGLSDEQIRDLKDMLGIISANLEQGQGEEAQVGED